MGAGLGLILLACVGWGLRICRDPERQVAAAKWLAGRLQERVAGQHVHHMTADVEVTPSTAAMAATVTLTVSSQSPGRRHYYFLLSPGVRLHEVSAAGQQCGVFRLWLLTRVTVPGSVDGAAPFPLTFRYSGDPTRGRGSVASGYLDADGALLQADAFWYPMDAQGFFDVDLTVRLPAGLTLVTSGDVGTDAVEGATRTVRQTWPRPLAGLALVAGRFVEAGLDRGDQTYRVYVPEAQTLQTEPLLAAMAESDALLSDLYGPSGFRRHVLVILPRGYRAFNDGSGLMGVPPRYLRWGDYGYRTIAHEIAHQWWGAVVAERWLDAGDGGEWFVEGFAEMSALLALERRFGGDALVLAMAGELFPPDAHESIAAMSVIDNVVDERNAQWTIYNKGPAVALLLRYTLGEETFARVCRRFCEEYRYRPVSVDDFARVAASVSGKNLDVFFARWVRGTALVDFAVEAGGAPGSAVVRNVGDVAAHAPIHVGVVQPERRLLFAVEPVELGRAQPDVLATPGTRLIVDPFLLWPDVVRSNNEWPARFPLRREVPAPRGGRSATVRGFPFDWEPYEVVIHGGGEPPLRYTFARGLTGPPLWWPDGNRVLVSVAADTADREPELFMLDAHESVQSPPGTVPGPRRVGVGREPVILDAHSEAILSVVDGRIVRQRLGAGAKRHRTMRGWRLRAPRVSPDGARVLCSAYRRGRSVLWVWDAYRPGAARQLLTGEGGRLEAWWLPDGRHAVVLGGRGDRPGLVLVDVDTGQARDLVTDKALIREVLITPAGQVVYTGRRQLAYPRNPMALFLLDPVTGAEAPIPLRGAQPGDSVAAPQWDPATKELVVVRERLVPDFSSRLWADRTLVRVPTS